MRIRHLMIGVAAAAVAVWSLTTAAPAADPIKVGYIGSFDTDTGKSTIRGTEIAIEELNANGGVLGGRMIELVMADTREDVQEGIRAYEYLNEVENVDFIISGCIDDVSLGWLERMAEYRTPTLDTWTSYVGIIDKVVEEYEKYKMYFMNVSNDYALAILYVDFGKDVLAKKMGWKTVYVLQEDTAFGGGVYELIEQVLAPEAGIEIIGHTVYDTNTVDFGPIYNKAVAAEPDFIYSIAAVRSQVPASQYVKLEVPVPMTGINVSAFAREFWDDTGGLGGGISTLSPVPSIGSEIDPRTQDFLDRYAAKYGDSRPVFPHFNGFNAYYGCSTPSPRRSAPAASRRSTTGSVRWRTTTSSSRRTVRSGSATPSGSRARSSPGPSGSTPTTSSSTSIRPTTKGRRRWSSSSGTRMARPRWSIRRNTPTASSRCRTG